MDWRRKGEDEGSVPVIPPGNTQGMGPFGAIFKLISLMRKCWNHSSGSGILLPDRSLPQRFFPARNTQQPEPSIRQQTSRMVGLHPFLSREILRTGEQKVPPVPELPFYLWMLRDKIPVPGISEVPWEGKPK